MMKIRYIQSFYTKRFTKKSTKTLATYHNAVRHTTSSAVFLKQNLLLVSWPIVSVNM